MVMVVVFDVDIKDKPTFTNKIILQLHMNWLLQVSLIVKNVKDISIWHTKDKVNDFTALY